MNSSYFHRFGRYNAWANRRLYEACAALNPTDYRAPRPSFFGSIHATLNHILVGDRVWMDRLEGAPGGIGDSIKSRDELRSQGGARVRRCAHPRLVSGPAEAMPARCATAIWREAQETPLADAGAFFNHQTHHRGQVHGMLRARRRHRRST
jgi:uncharacterized damage-inducible protein DinB